MSTKTSVTVELPDGVFQALCDLSMQSGISVESLIESALSEFLLKANSPKPQSHFELPSFNMGPPLPGVDINNSAALLDIMNADEYAEGYKGPYH